MLDGTNRSLNGLIWWKPKSKNIKIHYKTKMLKLDFTALQYFIENAFQSMGYKCAGMRRMYLMRPYRCVFIERKRPCGEKHFL